MPKGFDYETMYEHFLDSENYGTVNPGRFTEEMNSLWELLDDYYGEDWLLNIDYDDDEFWDIFRELYDRANT